MIRKKIISGALILVLMLQLLPLRQVISFFFIDNQLTEELAQAAEIGGKAVKFTDDTKIFFHHFSAGTEQAIAGISSYERYTETLCNLYISEIPTPPPNTLG